MNEQTRDQALHAIRNILLGQIQSAQTALHADERITDDAVHSARKALKGARATLRLLREVIGERRYAVENARLRNAAQPLSRVRDAKILLDTAGKLLESEQSRRYRELLFKVAKVLRRERKALRSELVSGGGNLKESLSILAASAHAIARWPLNGPKDALPSAIKRIYRKGQKAMRRAYHRVSDDALHEARKQTKYLA